MVFPEVLRGMILIGNISISIYMFLAIVIGLLSISVNILGRGRAVNGNGYLMYIATSSFLIYVMLTSLVHFYHGISQMMYYLNYMVMLILMLSITLILMREYSGDFMKRHTTSMASYSSMVIILSLITLFVYPGKPYLLNSYIFGFQALPESTVLLYSFFIIPISIVLSYTVFYTIFKNGLEKAPLYLGLGGLVLIANNGFKEVGSIYIIDLTLLIASLLLIFGFSKMKVDN